MEFWWRLCIGSASSMQVRSPHHVQVAKPDFEGLPPLSFFFSPNPTHSPTHPPPPLPHTCKTFPNFFSHSSQTSALMSYCQSGSVSLAIFSSKRTAGGLITHFSGLKRSESLIHREDISKPGSVGFFVEEMMSLDAVLWVDSLLMVLETLWRSASFIMRDSRLKF